MTTVHEPDVPAPAASATPPRGRHQLRPQVHARLVPGTATEVSVTAGRHSFTVDEPTSLGGTDRGANPLEHLLGALGACQVVTYQLWAKKLGIAVDSVDVQVVGDIDLRGFLGLADDVRPGFDAIHLDVRIAGPEPAERYEELLRQVEQRCPVRDNVGNPVQVRATIRPA